MVAFARTALLIGLSSFVVGCGPSGSPAPAAPTASAAPAAGAVASIDIQGFAFKPATLEIAKGTTVTWTNRDGTNHTVTATDKKFDSGARANGASFSFSFSDAGRFTYMCAIHGASMSGTIVVR